MSTTTSVFAGNAAIAYAAFNLRDPYYQEMARFVVNAAKGRIGSMPRMTLDLGAGIGISTMEILKDLGSDSYVIAIEPEEAMRYFCGLNTMGDLRVEVMEGRGEILSEVMKWYQSVNAIFCCQVFHLFNPPGKESLIPVVLKQVAEVLKPGGVFAFDLGPSNFEFATPLADHRSDNRKRGEMITELAHPLYQRIHEIVLDIVRRKFPKFEHENLWPPVSARMSFEYLSNACEDAGFRNLEVSEDFSPLSGKRIINFIRNGWTVFFRWAPLSELPTDQKLGLMNKALNFLFHEPNFTAMSNVMSYHPTAVFTAVKS